MAARGGSWGRMEEVALRVGAAAAAVPMGVAVTARPAALHEASARSDEQQRAEEEWWWTNEARYAAALLHVTREHERQARHRDRDLFAPAAGEDEEEQAQQRRAEMRRLRDQAAELEEQLFRRSELRSRQDALIAHMRLVPEHLRALFPTSTTENNEHGARMRDAVQHRDQKVSAFLDTHAELLQVERALEEVRQARLAQEAITRELWASLHHSRSQTQEEEQDDPEEMDEPPATRRRANELRVVEDENARLREIWQALIIESGANWATDEELRTTLFHLQSPLAFLHPNEDEVTP